jgi:hypothetical protein
MTFDMEFAGTVAAYVVGIAMYLAVLWALVMCHAISVKKRAGRYHEKVTAADWRASLSYRAASAVLAAPVGLLRWVAFFETVPSSTGAMMHEVILSPSASVPTSTNSRRLVIWAPSCPLSWIRR